MKKLIVQTISLAIMLTSIFSFVAFAQISIERRYEYQEKSNWCWVANARNLVIGERPTSRPPTKTQRDAVIEIKGSDANVQGFLNNVTDAADYISDGDYSYINTTILSWSTLRSLVEDLNSPGYLNIQHDDEGGHTLLMYGAFIEEGIRNLIIFDPSTGSNGGYHNVDYDGLRNGTDYDYGGYYYEDTIYCTAHN